MIGIYKIENLINHKVYIGQSTNIYDRWNAHRLYGRANDKYIHEPWYNYPLYCAMRKYGLENFEFSIIECTSMQQLDERERYWIEYYDSYNNGYNATTGGGGNCRITEEQKNLIIDMWNKSYLMEEISSKLNIDKHTVISFLKQYEPSYSIEEARRRGSIASGAAHRKKIDCYDLYNNYLRTYDSIRAAVAHLNIKERRIIECCKHKVPYYLGYRFAYHGEPLWEIPEGKRLTPRPIYKIDHGNKVYYPSFSEAVKQNNISEREIRKSIKNNQPTDYDSDVQWYTVDYSISPIITEYTYYTTEEGYATEHLK